MMRLTSLCLRTTARHTTARVPTVVFPRAFATVPVETEPYAELSHIDKLHDMIEQHRLRT